MHQMVTRILLESYWLLLGTWIPVQFVLIAMWSWRRTETTKRVVWSGFVVFPMLLVVSMLVVTDREKIVDQLIALARAVEQVDLDEIASHFAEDFEARGYSRERMLARIDARLTQYPVTQARISQVAVALDGDEAIVKFRGSANIRFPEIPYQYATFLWHSKWRRSQDGWLITSLEKLP